MSGKSLKVIAVTLVFCFTVMLAGISVSAEDSGVLRGLGNLRWGMTAEEAEAAMNISYDSYEEFDSYDQKQKLFTYENTELLGFPCYVILCVTEENGLEGVNFHIPYDDSASLYKELLESMKLQCTEYEETGDTVSLGHYEGEYENYTIFLMDLNGEVQYSYFPLFEKDERGDTTKGGNTAQNLVDYGSSNTAVYEALKHLKWGMSPEEAVEAMKIEPEHTVRGYENGGRATYLYYSEVPFKGNETYICIGFTDGVGLAGLNFNLYTEGNDGVYQACADELMASCSEYVKTTDGAEYYFDNENYCITMYNLVDRVQYSYFPIYSEEDDSSEDVQYVPCPDTGNTSSAVFVCFMAVSAIAAGLVHKKSNK